jgi:putative ABC transport system ATP-binding protein
VSFPAGSSNGWRWRAMVTHPRLLFADEPTGSLDTVAGEAVLGAMMAAARDHGTAVLLITHDATVAAYADREVHLRDGRVFEAALS